MTWRPDSPEAGVSTGPAQQPTVDTSGGGSSGATTTGTTTADTGPDHGATFSGLGGDPELWQVGDLWYIVHYAPGDFDPPIALLWEVPDEETLKAFGGGEIPKPDKTPTADEVTATGSIKMGTTDNLPEGELDPWTGFKERMDRAAEVQPWLTDPEVYALVGAAYVEGRALEQWELEATDWWQDRNDREREWARISMADPSTAEQMLAENRIMVETMFESIGAAGNDAGLIDWLATKYSTGQWDEKKLARQIEAVTSGWGEVDATLKAWMKEGEVAAVGTTDKQEDVRNLFSRWLGPAYPPSDAQVKDWATKLRNTASGDEDLVSYLRSQRLALYSEYENPDLTYEDIASPWRSVVSRMWGETADETSGMFQDIIKMNDLGAAEKMLRTEGRKQGNSQVMESYHEAITAATGGSLRRAT